MRHCRASGARRVFGGGPRCGDGGQLCPEGCGWGLVAVRSGFNGSKDICPRRGSLHDGVDQKGEERFSTCGLLRSDAVTGIKRVWWALSAGTWAGRWVIWAVRGSAGRSVINFSGELEGLWCQRDQRVVVGGGPSAGYAGSRVPKSGSGSCSAGPPAKLSGWRVLRRMCRMRVRSGCWGQWGVEWRGLAGRVGEGPLRGGGGHRGPEAWLGWGLGWATGPTEKTSTESSG